MGFCFSKPDKKQLLAESRERIENNARVLKVCAELAAETPLAEKAQKAYDSVRYLTPTDKVGAAQADKKINALAGDLKIALNKGSERAVFQAEDILKDIAAAVAERDSYSA